MQAVATSSNDGDQLRNPSEFNRVFEAAVWCILPGQGLKWTSSGGTGADLYYLL
ncbi:hypothetical protein M758_2G146500 [Ceratodon purpureus]|nr:hypothetical protein M758_2G146500 [Ceratodon purpureus]